MDNHPKPMLIPPTASNPHTTTPERRKNTGIRQQPRRKEK
jgi:hypothetical protein